MKNLYLLTILTTMNVFGQTNPYRPFPTIYGDWGVVETVYPPPTGGGSTQMFQYVYYTSGDTTINTFSYKKVNYINEGTYMGVSTPLNQKFTGGTYNFSYRNDSLHKKVYIVPGGNSSETLWYDFNVKVGDTLKNMYSVGAQTGGYAVKIDSLDSMSVCNNYYKKYYCSCVGSNYLFSKFCLIEGRGFNSNFINAAMSDNCVFEPMHIYSTDAWSLDECPNGLGIENYSRTHSLIKLYPNPANNSFTIETLENNKQLLQVFDVTGNLVLTQTISGTATIDANGLNAGVYNLNLISSMGVINKRLVIVK
jgi:hypothetical protein